MIVYTNTNHKIRITNDVLYEKLNKKLNILCNREKNKKTKHEHVKMNIHFRQILFMYT